MTEKDRLQTENMVQKAVATQNEIIGLHLKNIIDKLEVIDKKVSITNSKVAEHEKLIREIKEDETRHIISCPQKKDIQSLNDKLVNIEKIEVARDAVSKFSWKQVTIIGAIAGGVLSLLNFVFTFIF